MQKFAWGFGIWEKNCSPCGTEPNSRRRGLAALLNSGSVTIPGECNRDCTGDWSPFGKCGSIGKHTRSYTVSKVSARRRRGGGADCDPAGTQSGSRRRGVPANLASGSVNAEEDCKFDCTGEWSSWTGCLDTGKRKRTYTVKQVSSRRRRDSGLDCDPGKIDRRRRRQGVPATIDTGTFEQEEVCITRFLPKSCANPISSISTHLSM